MGGYQMRVVGEGCREEDDGVEQVVPVARLEGLSGGVACFVSYVVCFDCYVFCMLYVACRMLCFVCCMLHVVWYMLSYIVFCM